MRSFLRKKRQEKGYTQQKMADMLLISRPHYTKIESGLRTPTFYLAIKIKNVMEYEKDDLFQDE